MQEWLIPFLTKTRDKIIEGVNCEDCIHIADPCLPDCGEEIQTFKEDGLVCEFFTYRSNCKICDEEYSEDVYLSSCEHTEFCPNCIEEHACSKGCDKYLKEVGLI